MYIAQGTGYPRFGKLTWSHNMANTNKPNKQPSIIKITVWTLKYKQSSFSWKVSELNTPYVKQAAV